ncbi:MAG: hypothetical protein HY040_06015 [Planctomycetes bacterium]|nr:hypothetical protein [Planctomycetota bacterium]
MSAETIEKRLAILEAEVSQLKQGLEKDAVPWWKKWAGAFRNDPYIEKAVKYGRRYRESLRKPKKKRK